MHSKWKIWDFFRARAEVLNSAVPVLALSTYHPLAFQLIKDQIPKEKYFSDGKLNVLMGKEISKTWWEDNFLSLGLFGNQESYLIHQAQDLNSDIQELLLVPEQLILEGRHVILNFSKENAFYKKLMKLQSPLVESIQIQAPAFWEENELLNFLCEHMKVFLSFQAKEKFREMVPFQLDTYFQVLSQIKINFTDKVNITDQDILPFFTEAKVDHFELANLFGTKKLNLFYRKLVEQMEKGADLISALYFIQSHLVKMYDPSYLDEKSKLTKYDKQVIAHANIWSKAEIARGLNYMSKLLIKAKSKDLFLEQEIKHGLLNTMAF